MLTFLFFFFFCLFRATPITYGGSQARGQIGDVAAGLHHNHSSAGSELRLRPTPQLMAMLDPQRQRQYLASSALWVKEKEEACIQIWT